MEKIVFGFVFGVGVFLAVESGQWIEKEIKRNLNNKMYYQYTGGSELEIIEHADIRDMREYIIGGRVKNNTDSYWKDVRIEVTVLKNGIEVDTCYEEIWLLPEESTERFSLVCDRIFPERLTDEYTYNIEITLHFKRYCVN